MNSKALTTQSEEIAVPRGFTIRRPNTSDAEAIAEMKNAGARIEAGTDLYGAGEVLRELADPHRNPEDQDWLVIAPNGDLAGHLLFWDDPQCTSFGFGGDVHPDYMGHGIGTFMLQTIEQCVQRRLSESPENKRVVILTRVRKASTAARGLLAAFGYQHIRDWQQMEIDLVANPVSPPAVPDGITIRTLQRPQDERALWEVIESAFADHWGYMPTQFEEFIHLQLDGAPGFEPSLTFLAFSGKEVVGAVIGRGSRAGDTSFGWIGELGVRRDWRGRGIGETLLQTALAELQRRGRRRAGLSVDVSNPTGATRLYQRAGMRETRRDYIFEKVLRPAAETGDNIATTL